MPQIHGTLFMRKIMKMKKTAVALAFAFLLSLSTGVWANPFADVPLGHWAYDAMEMLSAKGIVIGYPDGTYQGSAPLTRYELATALARTLAVIDADKADREDLAILVRLMKEFRDELDAVGVQVEDLDSRLGMIEENLGGWTLRGEFRMDGKWDDNGSYTNDGTAGAGTDFDLNRYRLWISRSIDDDTSFTARLGNNNGNVAWEHYYVQTILGYDIRMQVGRFDFDWEGDRGLYRDNEAWFTDLDVTGFGFRRDCARGDIEVLAAHQDDPLGIVEYDLYGGRGAITFNERFSAGIAGLFVRFDDNALSVFDEDVLWADITWRFRPDARFRGAWFSQHLEVPRGIEENDDPKGWKAILELDRSLLRYTSLWLEYSHMDSGFGTWQSADGFGSAPSAWDEYGTSVLSDRTAYQDMDVIFLRLDQTWAERWSTYQRYLKADIEGRGDTKNWSFGIRHQLRPAVMFELAYDDIDRGTGTDDNLIRFRTHVKF